MENFVNDFATTLASAITTVGQTTVNVTSSTGAPAPRFRAMVDSEIIIVTAVAHPVWTFTRGAENTTPATHLNGATIAHILSKGGLDQYLLEWGPLQTDPLVASGDTRVIPAGSKLFAPSGARLLGQLNVRGSMYIR